VQYQTLCTLSGNQVKTYEGSAVPLSQRRNEDAAASLARAFSATACTASMTGHARSDAATARMHIFFH